MSTSLEASGRANLEEIASYIRNLKLKSVAFGGVDREAVLVSIQELYRMFTQAYSGVADHIDQLQSDLNSAYAYQEQLEQEANTLRGEKETMSQTIALQIESSTKAAETENKYRQNEADFLQQINELRSRNQELESALSAQETQYKRELELAKAGAADKSETLEEIYIEARRSRDEMLEKARQDADAQIEQAQRESEELLQRAEEEIAARWQAENAAYAEQQAAAEELLAASQKEAEALTAATEQEAEQIVADAREKADRLIADAQAGAEQMTQQSQMEAEESRRNCQAQEDAAQEVLDNAKVEGERIIASAKAAYTREREKYDALLVQLSHLRAKTVEDIRSDIAKLNEVAFGMTGRSMDTDLMNAVSLTGIDTASNSPAAAAAGAETESGEEASHEQE